MRNRGKKALEQFEERWKLDGVVLFSGGGRRLRVVLDILLFERWRASLEVLRIVKVGDSLFS